MGEIIVLGSGAAVPDENHEHTHLFFREGQRGLLIDCGSNPVLHLPKAGIQLDTLTDIFFTHFHPDHISGAPLLLMDLWLMGRKEPLNLYGSAHTLSRLQTVMDLYEWKAWPDFYPVHFHPVAEDTLVPVLENESFRVHATPVKHMVPTLGVRVEFLRSGRTVAYSCDTEPCSQMVQMAAGVDILIHESSGEGKGHSSSEQAAEIALEAGAGTLYLIHYDGRAGQTALDEMAARARQVFGGEVHLAQDFMVIPVG